MLMTTFSAMAQLGSDGKFYAFRLKPHEDLRTGLLNFAREHKLKAAAVVSCVGSLEEVVLRYANEKSGTQLKGYHEIVSLVGTLSDTSSHLHLAVSDAKGTTIGGHLLDGSAVYTTAEIVLVELTSLHFERETDSVYNYQELTVKKRKQ